MRSADGNLLPSPGDLAHLRQGQLDLARRHARPAGPAATEPRDDLNRFDVYARHYRVSGTLLATLVAASTLTSPTLGTTIGAGTVDVVDSLRNSAA
jgi:hypothetical protein